MAGGLQIQPLEVNDFSGGITENILQGDPRRYARADNLFITTDKKLEERPAIVADGDSTYQITGATGQRINGYFNFRNESVLMPQVSRNLFYKNLANAWTRIQGIGGKEALSGGGSYSQTTASEFQGQIYLATDDGVLPSKIYKDETNVWVARTAGLPRSWVLGNYTDSSLLAKCLENANAIRASMISHFGDSKYALYQTPTAYETSAANLHINVDRRALCYLQAVTFGADTNAPTPLPTPRGAATNEATLYLLITALNSAYTAHTGDAMLNSWGTHPNSTLVSPLVPPRYHQDMPIWTYFFSQIDFILQKTKGPGAPLAMNGAPDSMEEAAAMLDDLWTKWYWHRWAINTHDEQNNAANFNRYTPTGSKIGTVQLDATSFPTITPDWGDLYAYVNNLRFIYNSHVTNNPGNTNTSVHKQRDNSLNRMMTECVLPECTDLDSMYLLIWWLRSCYQLHTYDANRGPYQLIQYTSTAGSPNLSTVTYAATGVAVPIDFLTASYLYTGALGPQLNPVINTQMYSTPTYRTAKILSTTLGAAVMDRNAQTSNATIVGQAAASQYHVAQTNGAIIDSNLTKETSSSALSVDVTTYGSDTKSWLDLATDFFFASGSHIQNMDIHIGAYIATTTFQRFVESVPYANFFIPTISTVSYAMFFSDTYTVEAGGIEYLVNGNPIFSDSTEIAVSYPVGYVPENLYPEFYTAKAITVTRGNLLSNLPVLVNDATTNYAVANVKLNIYRTTDGGQTFFKVAEVANGTTSYLDVINDTVPNAGDTALDVREVLYTSGGVVGSDQPPVCKYTHLLNNTAYWGAVYDTGQFFPNRIRQSVQGSPDSAPATFFYDLDDELRGISSARSKLIAFCKSSIYRVEGGFNSQGQGGLSAENISDTLGCLNAKSIVRTEIGVFYAGTDGFYYTDGYQNIKISLELDDTYLALTASESQKRIIYGAYDNLTRRVWWSMKEDENDSDNSVVYVYYLDYGVKPSGVFTLIRNGLNFRPSSLVFQNGIAYISHEKGYLTKTDPWNKWDAVITPGVAAADWLHTHVPYNYTSTAIDLGTTFNRKWITKIHMVGQNMGNQSFIPYAMRDMNQTEQGKVPLAPVNYKENIRWGDIRPVWGDPSIIWKTSGKMDLWRRFPATTLRSDFMQVSFQPGIGVVYSSTGDYPELSYVTISGTLKTINLNLPPGYFDNYWPADVVGYTIRFAFDEYTAEWTIDRFGVNHAQLIVLDPLGTLPDVFGQGVEWEIWGIKKEQKFSMSSYVLHYSYLGSSNQAYPGATTNMGAGNGGENPG